MSKMKPIDSDQTKHKGGKGVVEHATPYIAEVDVVGTDPMLLHRYDVQDVKSKSGAAKGSKEKKALQQNPLELDEEDEDEEEDDEEEDDEEDEEDLDDEDDEELDEDE